MQFVIASVANILITVGVDRAARRRPAQGRDRRRRRQLPRHAGVYLVLLGYRRYQLGLQFDRKLLREMNRFGLPLVPSALALWAINFIDRLFVNAYKGLSEAGVYSLAVRASSVIVFLMIAFRLAWPAFAYSIEDDNAAKRTYSFVLTYLLFVCCWISLALGVLRAVDRQDPRAVGSAVPPRGRGGRPARVRYDGVRRLHRARDRHRPRAPDAVQLDRQRHRRRAEHRAQLRPDPALRDDGRSGLDRRGVRRAVRSGWRSTRSASIPSPYQWRRVATLSSVAIALTAIGYELALVADRDCAVPRLPAAAAAARLLPAGRTRDGSRRLVPLRG